MANENDTHDDDKDQDAMAAEWEAAMMEQGDEGDDDTGDAGSDSAGQEQDFGRDVDRVALDELTEDEQPNTNPNLDVILDIPVSISMEVGRTSITIRNLLQLTRAR